MLKALIPRAANVRRLRRRAGNAVLLTFDDGPDPEVTPGVLERLDAYGAKAVFFVVGRRVKRAPHLLMRMAERGHLIGNHSHLHRPGYISAALAQLEEHQRPAVLELQREPVPANLLLVQDAGAELVVLPDQTADRILILVHLQETIGLEARLAVIIGCIADPFPFAAVSIFPVQHNPISSFRVRSRAMPSCEA